MATCQLRIILKSNSEGESRVMAWLDIERKAEAIMQATERNIRASEISQADREPTWDGRAIQRVPAAATDCPMESQQQQFLLSLPWFTQANEKVEGLLI